jgi:hypothetical protein
MALFPVVHVFFGGGTILKQHEKNGIGLPTPSEWTSGRALTPMTGDQQRDVPRRRCPQLIGSCIEPSKQKGG